jgi:gamma-glutamylcyclotransferase (GGCT)/AIG2-like uncharacterized protein YtfP
MDVFVYGTLTDPRRVAAVVDSYVFVGPAVLDGCHPVAGRYPTLAPGEKTAGRLLRTEERAALDAYEGVDDGWYVRAPVPRTDGGRVAVYVGRPSAVDSEEPIEWPGAGPFADRVRRYLEAEAVVRPGEP